VVGSSLGWEPVDPSPRTGAPFKLDTVEEFTGLLNWEQGEFVALR
jgi:hypothetical protein